MASIWVDGDTGSNTGTSSEGSPWQTFAYAAPRANPGDVIYVAPRASYAAYAGVTATVSGTAALPIEVRPWAVSGRPAYPVFSSSSTRFVWRASYWRFYGIIWRGSATNQTCFVIGDNNAAPQTSIIFDGCVFGTLPDHAVRIASGDNIYFYRNLIYACFSNVADDGTIGVLANHRAVNCRVWYNTFIDIASQGIQLVAEAGLAANWNVSGWSVEYNTFIANNESGAFSSRGYFTGKTVERIGENGTAQKQGANNIAWNKNYYRGFRDTVTGQDTSGGAVGDAHRSINGSTGAEFKNNFCKSGSGAGFTLGFQNPTVVNNVFRTIPNFGDGYGMKFQSCANVTALHNTVLPTDTLQAGADALIYRNSNTTEGAAAGVQNNYFAGLGVDEDGTGGNFDYNAWDLTTPSANLAGANDLDTPITDGLTSYGAPQSGSDLLEAGALVGVGADFLGRSRPAAPAIGAMELDIKSQYPANVLLDDFGTHREPEEFYDEWIDAEYGIWPFAVSQPTSYINRWGYTLFMQDTTGKYMGEIFASSLSQHRLRVYLNIDWLTADGDGDVFTFLQGRTSSQVAWRLDLRYDATNDRWNLRGRYTLDSLVESNYLPTIGSTGTPLTRHTWYRVEVYWSNSGTFQIYLNTAGQEAITLIDQVTGADNDTLTVDRIRIGATSISSGIGASTATSRYEDGCFRFHSIKLRDDNTAIGDIDFETDSGSGSAVLQMSLMDSDQVMGVDLFKGAVL